MLNVADGRATTFVSIRAYSEVSGDTSTGNVINVGVGRNSVGSFSARGILRSANDGIVMSESKDKISCRLGSKPWILVRFALIPGNNQIDGHHTEYVHMLGFSGRAKIA